MPAKRPTWKDSKYADAKGKFKSLSPSSLATWLIKSRRRNKRAIIGSLNQQKYLIEKKSLAMPKKWLQLEI
jgi:phage gpG-like protein